MILGLLGTIVDVDGDGRGLGMKGSSLSLKRPIARLGLLGLRLVILLTRLASDA